MTQKKNSNLPASRTGVSSKGNFPLAKAGTSSPNLPSKLSLAPQICPSPSRIVLNPATLIRPLTSFLGGTELGWQMVLREHLTATQIFERYVFLLAGIGPLSGSIGYYIAGRITKEEAVFFGMSSYGLILLFFFGATYLAHILASALGGQLSLDRAANLIVYSFMPFFVFLGFFLFPPISFLSLVGTYGIVLFFRGVPILANLPRHKQLFFIALNVVIWIFFVEMMRCSVFVIQR